MKDKECRSSTYRKGTSTPWGATTDLSEVGKGSENRLVSERDVDDTVVGEGGEGIHDGRLLTTAGGTGGNKDSGVFAPEGTGLPLATGLVPEGLPLGREVTVSGRDAEKETIIW